MMFRIEIWMPGGTKPEIVEHYSFATIARSRFEQMIKHYNIDPSTLFLDQNTNNIFAGTKGDIYICMIWISNEENDCA